MREDARYQKQREAQKSDSQLQAERRTSSCTTSCKLSKDSKMTTNLSRSSCKRCWKPKKK
ncbi:unnamed protein product [Caenorhabditis brenneri]